MPPPSEREAFKAPSPRELSAPLAAMTEGVLLPSSGLRVLLPPLKRSPSLLSPQAAEGGFQMFPPAVGDGDRRDLCHSEELATKNPVPFATKRGRSFAPRSLEILSGLPLRISMPFRRMTAGGAVCSAPGRMREPTMYRRAVGDARPYGGDGRFAAVRTFSLRWGFGSIWGSTPTDRADVLRVLLKTC